MARRRRERVQASSKTWGVRATPQVALDARELRSISLDAEAQAALLCKMPIGR